MTPEIVETINILCVRAESRVSLQQLLRGDGAFRHCCDRTAVPTKVETSWRRISPSKRESTMDAANHGDLTEPIKRLLELYADGSGIEEIRDLLMRMGEIATRVDQQMHGSKSNYGSPAELELDEDALVIALARQVAV